MAFLGQFFSHLPHFMHPVLQAFKIAGLKGLLFEHKAMAHFKSLGIRVRTFWGQLLTHIPHPVHLDLSIKGNPFSPMVIAPKGQTLSQSPRPIHPHWQSLTPPVEILAPRHDLVPV